DPADITVILLSRERLPGRPRTRTRARGVSRPVASRTAARLTGRPRVRNLHGLGLALGACLILAAGMKSAPHPRHDPSHTWPPQSLPALTVLLWVPWSFG